MTTNSNDENEDDKESKVKDSSLLYIERNDAEMNDV